MMNLGSPKSGDLGEMGFSARAHLPLNPPREGDTVQCYFDARSIRLIVLDGKCIGRR